MYLSGDDCNLGHRGFSVSVQQLGTVANDSIVFLIGTCRRQTIPRVTGCGTVRTGKNSFLSDNASQNASGDERIRPCSGRTNEEKRSLQRPV